MSFIPVIITLVFSVTCSFRNTCYMLIWCTRNMSYYYHCQYYYLFIFCGNPDTFSGFFFWGMEISKGQHLFETKIS